jgi:prepilin-type N-terminal cleavage/methylation domain-containing protein
MNQRGLTLVELLAAMAILGVSLAALISLWSFGFNVTKDSQDTAVAYSIARREIEQVRNIGFSSLPRGWSNAKTGQPNQPGKLGQGYDYDAESQTWVPTTSATPHFMAYAQVDPSDSVDPNTVSEGSLRLVRVRVWQREGNRLVVQTESYLTREGV